MSRTCSSCGAVTAAETRFCRHCGALLKAGATFGENETISPLAQTIPLSGEGHTTSGLGANDTGGTASETKRVRSEEMERLLRRSALETVSDGGNIHESAAAQDYVAPPTSTLALPALAPAGAPAPAVAAAAPRPVAPASRKPRAWLWIAGLLLLVALPAAVFAYYLLHRSSAPENANNATAVANSNQTTEPVNANSSQGDAGEVAAVPPPTSPEAPPEAQAGETPKPSPKPSASPLSSPSRDARVRTEPERETPAPVQATEPPSALTSSPVAQAAPTPPPAAANSVNGTTTTTTAQADSDVFYFQAVNIINGRDPRAISRAELLRALQLFQNVKNGPHAGEAKRQAERLGRELDRLRKRSQP